MAPMMTRAHHWTRVWWLQTTEETVEASLPEGADAFIFSSLSGWTDDVQVTDDQ